MLLLICMASIQDRQSPSNCSMVVFTSTSFLSADPSRSDVQDSSMSPIRFIGAVVLPVLQALSSMPLEMIMAEQVVYYTNDDISVLYA
jgi:hypothetical protein